MKLKKYSSSRKFAILNLYWLLYKNSSLTSVDNDLSMILYCIYCIILTIWIGKCQFVYVSSADFENNKTFGYSPIPFVATHLKGRFFVFYTVGFLLFLAPAGPIA